MKKHVAIVLPLVCGTLLLWSAGTFPLPADELMKSASWSQPDAAEVEARLRAWLSRPEFPEAARERTAQYWITTAAADDDLLQRVVETIATVDEQVAALVAACRRPYSPGQLPSTDFLQDASRDPFARHNVQLYFGKWLAMNQLYNESLEQLSTLQCEQVVDPASLLFYRGAALYRLREKDEGLSALTMLLENEAGIPERYATLARLMEADLAPLKPDSLDEVARIMDSIRVRLAHGRAGVRVRQEEEDVVAKLEKMIEQLEEQLQQCSACGGAGCQRCQGAPQGIRSSSPASDSALAGGNGPGDVDAKRLDDATDWGNLPPKERQEALQELGKDFPSHYREVIEEYFRKLAREEVGDE